MAEMASKDVFKSVHKGLRKALFEFALQVGATDATQADEVERLAEKAKDVFRFVEHHAFNEDNFLIPLMEAKSMTEAIRMRNDHGRLEADLEKLGETAFRLHESPARFHGFYLSLTRFISDYLLHLYEEEAEIKPAIDARFTGDELADFSRKSVASTPPKDQEMMLSYMFPAMDTAELKDFFSGMRGKAPAEVMSHLEGIARSALGDRIKSIF